MFLLGGATTGLWLASTGLVRLQRSFVLSLAGSCSFCGKAREDVHALVGTAGHATRICDECIWLCWEILGEEAGQAPPQPAPPRAEDEQFQHSVGEVLERFAAEAELESWRNDVLLGDLRRALEARARRLSRMDDFCCSVCGAPRKDVAKLISGPRVFICDGCVGDATAVVSHVLRAV
jgi:hypothetical protein